MIPASSIIAGTTECGVPFVSVRGGGAPVFIGGRAKPSIALEPNGRVLRRGLGREDEAVNADHETARDHQWNASESGGIVA